jgi:tetratricopeptide (TPR) repeat protein
MSYCPRCDNELLRQDILPEFDSSYYNQTNSTAITSVPFAIKTFATKTPFSSFTFASEAPGSPSDAYCTCGWINPKSSIRATNKAQTKTIKIMVTAAILVSLSFAHLAYWGAHSVSGPVLTVEAAMGSTASETYRELAKICIERNRWSCAREAYLNLQRLTKDGTGLIMLARLHVKLGEIQAALTTLGYYFRTGGQDGEAALQYAKLLESSGDLDSAIKYYDASVAMRPNVLPIQATTGSVRILIQQAKYEDAHNRIVEFQAGAENAKGYLNTELAQVEQALKDLHPQRHIVSTNAQKVHF